MVLFGCLMMFANLLQETSQPILVHVGFCPDDSKRFGGDFETCPRVLQSTTMFQYVGQPISSCMAVGQTLQVL